jgi:DHA1 family multidrug resistance protein-like MFS transporter
VPWRVTFWLIVAVSAISSTSFSIALPFQPLFIQQLGVHPLSAVLLWSGITQSVMFLTNAVFAPLWGGVADRFGRKAMVVRASVFGSISTLLMGLSLNVGELVGARALLGMFSGFSAASTALVSSIVPESLLGFALGWVATAQMVGTLIGPLIGGAIADVTHNYRTVYFITAAGLFVAAMVAAVFVKEKFERKPRGERVPGATRARIREILTHPEIAPLFVVLMLAQGTTVAVAPIIPLYVQDMMGPSPYIATFAGAAFAVIGIGDLVASPWLGKRSDVIGYRRVLLISLCGAALFTIPQGFVHNVWAFLALRFGVGLFLGGIFPTANAWVGRLFSADKRGMVYGLSYSATSTAMFIGPITASFLAARFGFAAVFLVTAGLILANAVWVAFGLRPADPARGWA